MSPTVIRSERDLAKKSAQAPHGILKLRALRAEIGTEENRQHADRCVSGGKQLSKGAV